MSACNFGTDQHSSVTMDQLHGVWENDLKDSQATIALSLSEMLLTNTCNTNGIPTNSFTTVFCANRLN